MFMVEFLIVAVIYHMQADVAQVVAHLIGSEEVTGPSPVISFVKPLIFQGFSLFVLHFVLHNSSK